MTKDSSCNVAASLSRRQKRLRRAFRLQVVPKNDDDNKGPASVVDATISSVNDVDNTVERQAAYFNGTHEIIPIVFDPVLATAASDAVLATVTGKPIPEGLSHEQQSADQPAWIRNILTSYWGPRLVLAAIPAIYGTNFALGSLMNDALPASAVTATRMTLATIALAPWLVQIKPSLVGRSAITGAFTAMGYVAQSIALVNGDPARISFLGAATVLWLPVLESTIDKTPMGWKDSPQTWISAALCILGVGVLELYDPVAGAFSLAGGAFGTTDILALLQAVGFGTGVFLSAKMVREEPGQVIPVTATLVATTAVCAWIWCLSEGSIGPLQELFSSDPSLHIPVLAALLWTGIVSTSINFVVEIAALGYVPSSEAAVLLASEPVWAALFAAFLLGESMGGNDYVGGALIVGACLVNALVKPSDIQKLLGRTDDSKVD